jgi:glycosyltransferase involved in cell wall biosynthesis
VTYAYYITVRAIEEVKEKAILIPTAHHEAQLYFRLYEDVFSAPRAFVFNTEDERKLVHRTFNNQDISSDIVGVGVDIPTVVNSDMFKTKYNLGSYILYAGRIHYGKNCPELFDYFIRYKNRYPSALKLVLMGRQDIDIPAHPDILSLGFVSEEDKINIMANAKMLVLPSVCESLSIVVLESMALGVPVVVNGHCEVLRGHCLRSNGGLFYMDHYEFGGCINHLLLNDGIYKEMSKNAGEYVEEYYRWDVVTSKLRGLIEGIRNV